MLKKIKIIITISLTMLLFFFWVPAVSAPAEDKNSLFVIELINWIRTNPVGYAESLGYDRSAVLQYSFLSSKSATEINLLSLSSFLMEKVAFDNAEAPLGDGPVTGAPEMTLASDYADTGDFNGTIFFAGFLEPLQAVRVVVNDQFVKELDPFYAGTRYILSSAYNNIGASLRSGQMAIGSGTMNAYFIRVCFGSALLKSEAQVVSMINQLRANPDESYKYLPLNMGFLAGGYQPLFVNGPLNLTAQVSLSQVVDYEATSRDYDYLGDGVVESSVFETFPRIEAELYAKAIFSSLVLNEAKVYPAKNSIFNMNYNSIGLATYYVGGEDYDFAKLTVVAGSAPKEDLGLAKIYGVLYVDADKDGCYGPGEELADREVTVYEKSAPAAVSRLLSNNAGYFSIDLPVGGQYVFQSTDVNGRALVEVHAQSDQFLGVIVEPVEDITIVAGQGN